MRYIKSISDYELDRMKFTDTPSDKHQERLNTPLSFDMIKCDPSAAPVRIPPANSSFETYQELLAMQDAIATISTEDQHQLVKESDEDFEKNFRNILRDNGIKFNLKKIQQLVKESAEIAIRLKYIYNRPRPWQLAPMLGIQLHSDDTMTAKSPSFPSGHALQSRLVARVLSNLYPELEGPLMEEADRVAYSRFIGGLHFPSDLEYGQMLGDWMSQYVDLEINESKTIGNKEVESNQELNPTQLIEEEDERLNKIRRYKGKIQDFKSYWDDRISKGN